MAATRQIGAELQELLATLLDDALGTVLSEAPDLTREATGLATDIRAAQTTEQLGACTGPTMPGSPPP